MVRCSPPFVSYDIIRIKVMGKEQVTPKQWKKCMRNADNKKDLINFLLRDWSTNERHIPILKGKYRYITIRDRPYCIYLNQKILSCGPTSELSSSQEEADTMVFVPNLQQVWDSN